MSDDSDRLTARIALQLKALTRQAADAGLHQLAATVYVAASEAERSTEQPHEYGTAPGEGTHPPLDRAASAAREELVTQLEYLRTGAMMVGDPYAGDVLKEAISKLTAH